MRKLALFVVMTLTFVGCKGGSDSAPPARPSTTGNSAPSSKASNTGKAAPSGTPSATSTESILAPEEQAEPTTRPAVLLIVQGGEGDIVYRGWPIRIAYRRLDGTPGVSPPLSVRGPTDVTPQAVPQMAGLWLIAPEKSVTLTPGDYVFTAGDASAEVVVANEPAELSSAQKEARQIALLSHALALGDAAGAERIARAWIAASPKSPTAHEALGDALLAAGKPDDALKAYNEALRRAPPSDPPPRSLYGKVGALRQKVIATMPTRPGAAPSADDVAYYKIVDEGDGLVTAADYVPAVRAYDRARSYYTSHNLTLGLEELERKVAYAREQQKRPKAAPTTAPAPR